jgi:beta-lactam-binding protein with PASTA domain
VVTPTDAVGTPGSTTTFAWTITGVTVPDLRGVPMADAQHEIAALGLVPSVTTRKACTDPGAVIQQNPMGGAVVRPGSTVRTTVDSGTPSTCAIG